MGGCLTFRYHRGCINLSRNPWIGIVNLSTVLSLTILRKILRTMDWMLPPKALQGPGPILCISIRNATYLTCAALSPLPSEKSWNSIMPGYECLVNLWLVSRSSPFDLHQLGDFSTSSPVRTYTFQYMRAVFSRLSESRAKYISPLGFLVVSLAVVAVDLCHCGFCCAGGRSGCFC